MTINGKKVKFEKQISVFDYLKNNNYNLSHIAIELDGEIIDKKDYETAMLKDDSVLEIVQFMGGG